MQEKERKGKIIKASVATFRFFIEHINYTCLFYIPIFNIYGAVCLSAQQNDAFQDERFLRHSKIQVSYVLCVLYFLVSMMCDSKLERSSYLGQSFRALLQQDDQLQISWLHRRPS